jgi:hypothetical protein
VAGPGSYIHSVGTDEDDRYAFHGDEETQRDHYRELLEELRTVLPGVQVLFAFLLAAPFSARFGDLDDLGRDVYLAVILGVALATVTFMAPAAYHRMGDGGDRPARLRISVRLAMAGMTLLGASLVGVLFVIVRFVYGSTLLGAVFAALLGVTIASLWYVLPAIRAVRHRQG